MLTFDASEDDIGRLADEIAFMLQPGDILALEGDLGAGKTTFARALIRTLSGEPDQEVVSPTFTLVQSYATPRFEIAHFDLYRMIDPAELDELGLDAALSQGIAVIEWPSQGGPLISDQRFTLRFAEADDPGRRLITLHASGMFATRLDRFVAIRSFLLRAGWADKTIRLRYLQGDASPRRYARLERSDGVRAILMDAPRQPDGPPVHDGLPYSRIAHLAEDVRAFVAIGTALKSAGFSTPEIFAYDLDAGLLLIEDLGDAVFASEVRRGRPIEPLWRRATDTLLALRQAPPPTMLLLPDGTSHTLTNASASVFQAEIELLLDWYWPSVIGTPAPETARAEFLALWENMLARVLSEPSGWLLRDYHSPNLIALDDRRPPADVGLIDFQDAMIGPLAYDVVSLLQDARVDLPEGMEATLLDYYMSAAASRDTAFARDAFRFSYAALGAQRNSKILGIFARLAKRDGKRQYLAHIPRIWRYLAHNLEHPDLARLKAWYDRHLPVAVRSQQPGA